MACNHRFRKDLIPDYSIKNLFIGTFNPEWNKVKDNANWFYGRNNNSFWHIMPLSLDFNDLLNERTNRPLLEEFCKINNIGITDLISQIKDADSNNPNHGEKIRSVRDNDLEYFDEIIFTDIEQIIRNNKDTLIGVYLTRYAHTFPRNGQLLQKWNQIIELCNEYKIHTSDLVTPSNGYFRMNRIQKIEHWRNKINSNL